MARIGNNQVKDNKIDLLVQQYEQFIISEGESIDSNFDRFNTIITSLKALDEGYSSKNYVRKFLRALHPKWRAKVTAIEESKDLTLLSLDELIGNLKVHEMIIKQDSEIVKAKVERKSLALKAKKESSDEECSTFGSEDKEYDMAVRDFKKFFKRIEYPKPPKDKNQRAFVGGSWSDSGEEDDEKVNNKTYLVAQASSEICLGVDLEPDEWIKDSGCSKHMTGNRKLFSSYKAYNGGNVIFGSNIRGNIIGKGKVKDNHTTSDQFDETPPPSKTSPLVDDDLDKEESIKARDYKGWCFKGSSELVFHGCFEMLSIFGSFMVSENDGQRNRTRGLNLSLSGPDGRVLGRNVARILVAASPVQVTVLASCQHSTLYVRKYCVSELSSCAGSELGSELTFLCSELSTLFQRVTTSELQEDIQCAGSDTRPPMLDRTDFSSWKQRIRLYCRGKENEVNILKSIDKGHFQMGTFRETLAEGNEGALNLGTERPRVYSDLSPEDKERYNADIRMLLEGSELTKEDRESQLYDDFEHFRQHKGETIHDYYVQFAKLINDMRNIKMTMFRMQLNSTVVVQNVQGRQDRGQGNNARGAGAAGYGGTQNRVRNTNPGQARQENEVALDEEQLLFIAGGQDNAIDEDVDEKPVQDLALNVDNVFQADDCDAFDSDVDEAPTAQNMFMANLSFADPVYNETSPSYDSNILSEYVKDNAVPVVQSNVSSIPNDVYMMIFNDMHEPHAQSISDTTQNTVVDNSLTAELATYKE
ncbi:integrase, catalytic region, zinc finger, CCHC-type containing protein [Tanacetum coccineum]